MFILVLILVSRDGFGMQRTISKIPEGGVRGCIARFRESFNGCSESKGGLYEINCKHKCIKIIINNRF